MVHSGANAPLMPTTPSASPLLAVSAQPLHSTHTDEGLAEPSGNLITSSSDATQAPRVKTAPDDHPESGPGSALSPDQFQAAVNGRSSGRKRTPKACDCCGPNGKGHNVTTTPTPSRGGRGRGRPRGRGRGRPRGRGSYNGDTPKGTGGGHLTRIKPFELNDHDDDDDDDDDDKAKVNVMKPVGEPEESAAQPEATVCPCMLCSKTTDTAAEAVEKAEPPKKASIGKPRRKVRESRKTEEKPKRKAFPRNAELEEKIRRVRKVPGLLRGKKVEKPKTVRKEKEQPKQEVPESGPEVGPCRPSPVYCPTPPGWFVHHIVTDNPYPPPTLTAPSAPVLTAHPVYQGVPPLYQPQQHQQQPMPHFYPHYHPYMQPQTQPAQPPVDASPPVQQADPAPTVQQADPVPTVQQADPAPTVQQADPAPTVQQADSAPTVQQADSAPMVQQADSAPIVQHADSAQDSAQVQLDAADLPEQAVAAQPQDYDASKNMTIAGAVKKGERKASSVGTKAAKMKAKKEAVKKTTAASKKEPSSLKRKAKVTVSGKDRGSEVHPVRPRVSAPAEGGNVTVTPRPATQTNTRSKATIERPSKLKPEPKMEDDTTDKKKTGQRYFQCIYVPGKGAQYPLRPGMSPAMNPAMMSPAIRSMLEQQRAARAAGQ